jgi:uncharacterized protein (DUF2235 family)
MKKRLVLTCDGTWNRADQERDGEPCPTNVIRIGYRIAKRSADLHQVIYYDQGVGTGNVLDKFSGGAFGNGLEDNIHDAYRFLVANYEPGDELFFFGFSRGAFTCRSIAGMIRKCGILDRRYVKHYRDAIELYRNDEHPDDNGPRQFRESYSVAGKASILIHFIGVWDTVGALGIPLRGLRWLGSRKHQFHDTELSSTVKIACHALAIDEHRAPFAPALWDYVPKEGQRIEQAWFCGAHSDVGGGYAERELSDITLDWMMGKAAEAGLAFDRPACDAQPLCGNPQGKMHNSKTGLYRMTAGIDRVIGKTIPPEGKPGRDDPTQSVHASVLQRWDSDRGYRPGQLREYFERVGDPRAEAD